MDTLGWRDYSVRSSSPWKEFSYAAEVMELLSVSSIVKSVLKLLVIVHWESAKPQLLLVCNRRKMVFSSDLNENSSWESGEHLNSTD